MSITEAQQRCSASPASPPHRARRPRWVWAVAIAAPAVAAAMLIAVFGLAHVENDSMAPTLRSGDLVLFDRVATPMRGDLILFADRGGWSPVVGATLVKRVVALAGDTVACCEAGSGRLIVNGAPVDEPYVAHTRPGGSIPFRVTVPDGAVWVIGDNRAASVDSRSAVNAASRGGVELEDIRGVIHLIG